MKYLTLKEKIKKTRDVLKAYFKWCISGFSPPPPHVVKQRIVKKYAKHYQLDTLVETGTYLGEMIEATQNTFKKIVSIELDHCLYLAAKDKFAGYPHISIVEGDSGKVLPSILKTVDDGCLFWLDGHYSGVGTSKSDKDTPIIEELNYIFNSNLHRYAILIDDARCFNGTNDYPHLDIVRKMASEKNLKFAIKNDIIRIYNEE